MLCLYYQMTVKAQERGKVAIMINNAEMELTLTRIEVCDLLIACVNASERANDSGAKWVRLHDKIRKQLDSFDSENNNDFAAWLMDDKPDGAGQLLTRYAL